MSSEIEGGLKRSGTIIRKNSITDNGKGSQGKLKGKKVQSLYTMADYWTTYPKHFYLRQAIVLMAEISFLVCSIFYLTQERDAECYFENSNNDIINVGREYRKALILAIILHIYLIIKVIYFAWSLK
jgi:hypothetical protein